MKKLALLLGALSLVSSVAYAKEVVPAVEEVVVVEEVKAAPMLRVTNFGQFIEIDNTAGGYNIGEQVWFANKLGLAYGDDWTFGITAAKMWSMDTSGDDEYDGIHSVNHRLEIDAWKSFDNYALGFRYRGESEFDRYYLRGTYNYGMLSGSADVWYHAVNDTDAADNYEMELIPVRLNYGPFGIGYFFNYKDAVGSVEKQDDDFDHWMEHQIRAYANFALTEKLSGYAEYRLSLGKEVEDPKGSEYDLYDAFDYHKLEVGLSYALTEDLSVYGYYAYELGDVTSEAKDKYGQEDYRYGEFVIGWDYKF